MREPPLSVRALGHPLVTVPVGLGGIAFLYACWQMGGDAALPAIITLMVLAWVGKANDHMNGYRAWKRAWDGMAQPRAGRSSTGWWRKPLGMIVIALVVVYLAANDQQPEYRLALGWMMLVASVAVVIGLWRVVRGKMSAPRDRRSKNHVVTICARPMTKAPPLVAAYQAMPDYCHQLMAPR